MAKKVLIVSYYWPPAGGPGVQRWLKFTKYLPEFDVLPYVMIPENPSYPILDETLVDEVGDGVEIIKKSIWEPYQLAEKINPKNKAFKAGQFAQKEKQSFMSNLSVFVRGNFFIPDARVFWVKPSIKFLEVYLQENQIDTIVTSGPPHSLHLIGLGLKQKNPQLNWLADFRDPWTEISYHKDLKLTNWAYKKHKTLEKQVMSHADVVLATSYSDAKNFQSIGAKKVEVLTNGYEEVNIQTPISEDFSITYSGGLEAARNPKILWQVLGELIKDESFANHFYLDFYGMLSEEVRNDIFASGLGKHLREHGYVTHQESLEAIRKASILLLTNFDNQQSKGIIPGKIFEYMAAKRPILAIGPKDSDVEIIMSKSEVGCYFQHNQYDEIKLQLKDWFKQWLNGNLSINSNHISEFSRKNITAKLAEILKN